MVAILRTRGYHCKELPVPKRLELMVPNLKSNYLPGQGTADSQWLELMVRYRFVLFNGRLAQNAPFGLNGCM